MVKNVKRFSRCRRAIAAATLHVVSIVGVSGVAMLWLAGSTNPASAQIPLPPIPLPPLPAIPLPPAIVALLSVQLERFSGTPMLLTAKALGITSVQGRAITADGSSGGERRQKRLLDVPIGNHATKAENEPTLAVNPKNDMILVAGSHFFGPPAPERNRCLAYASRDGGSTWSAGIAMPQLTADSECSDPVLAYSPDGLRVFYAYMDVKLSPKVDYDILVSYSDDNGRTWKGPVVALDGAPNTFVFDKPWIATASDRNNYASVNSQVYLTATRFDQTGTGNCHIVFTRSTNKGASYAAPLTLDTGAGCGTIGGTVVQGSRPFAKQGKLLVAWYHSGNDGYLNGSFKIRTRYSATSGATFQPIVDAVTDSAEVPFFLGPVQCYERWWPVMFPDVEIDDNGKAHILYAHDPAPGSSTAEDGDIRYATSASAPYNVWSRGQTVNDDRTISAQGFGAFDAEDGSLHATWMDYRLSRAASAATGIGSQCSFTTDINNLFYDIFYSTALPGQGWGRNVRVTDDSSLGTFTFLGDYIDLKNGSAFAVWTDRRDKVSIFDNEDDVWGGRARRP